ncbi:unnamed protein product, partial [Discosporangium mesarthrocarpum]
VSYEKLVTDFEALQRVKTRLQELEESKIEGQGEGDTTASAKAAVEGVERYLSTTPASGQNRDSVAACVKALSSHRKFMFLTAPERMQMINHQPEHAVQVHLMIEDCHRRFSGDEHVDELIEIVRDTVGLDLKRS